MSYLSKAVILGFLTGIFGVVVSILPFGPKLDENLGLDLLYKLRGARQAPSEVVVVGIDKVSADNLNLHEDPRKWPRSLHAQLTENLVNKGAQVIVFDIFFDEPHSNAEDNLFAETIRKSRNVVLCECLKHAEISLAGKRGSPMGDIDIVRVMKPIPIFSQSAIATAPFPLPKVPVKLSRYWMFKTAAGDKPTLPVVAFQIFTMQVYDDFIHLLKKVSPYQAEKLPRDINEIIATRSFEKLIRVIRQIFKTEPLTAEKMLKELQSSKTPSVNVKKHQMIKSLIKMYQGTDSQYLNLYGPPRTITTIPYYQVLQPQKSPFNRKMRFDVKGKAVFVGLSALSPTGQTEGFYTVFSKVEGLDISGVEIAATAFANLLENTPVRPLSPLMHLTIVLLWGMAIGVLCRLLPTGTAVLSVIVLIIMYLFAAVYQFKTSSIWYPFVIPIFFQSQIAFFSAVLWKYSDSIKERQNIKKAFKYYLPTDVVDQLAKNIVDLKTSRQLVYGICLSTDAERYTSLSETMSPEELSSFLDKYYETIFRPIKQHNGIVSDVVGDSILAVWVAKQPETSVRYNACLAALDIAKAILQLKQSSDDLQLPTRIGLHSGNILFGSVGAIDHYEYRPVGDIVNAAARIEGLNKYLGTRILASEEVINQLDGLLTKELGKFLLAGKSKPLVIYELLSRIEESNEQQRSACAVFAEALNAFRRQSWDEAIEKFSESNKLLGGDEASLFYIKLCEQYKEKPLEESWDGVVCMDKK